MKANDEWKLIKQEKLLDKNGNDNGEMTVSEEMADTLRHVFKGVIANGECKQHNWDEILLRYYKSFEISDHTVEHFLDWLKQNFNSPTMKNSLDKETLRKLTEPKK